MANKKTIEIDGLKVTFDIDALGSWSTALLLERLDGGNVIAGVTLIQKLFGDDMQQVLKHLDPEGGDPSVDSVTEFFTEVMKAASGDDDLKN